MYIKIMKSMLALVPCIALSASSLKAMEELPLSILVHREHSEDNNPLSLELKKFIQSGNIIALEQYFEPKIRSESPQEHSNCNTSTLIKALAYTGHEIESLEEIAISRKKSTQCCSRYKGAIMPGILIAFSVANITLSVLSYNAIPAPTPVDIASLCLNVSGSALSGILYSTYETIKHIRGGWRDIEYHAIKNQLKTSHVFLKVLREKSGIK